jgi:hypothetical protein
MDVQEALSEAGGAMTAKRVYAEPYVHDGLTIIPAAAVRGGGGGGGDEATGGAGFGLHATPKGAWVVEGDKVTWKPAVDVNRIVLGSQIVAVAALLTARQIATLWAPGHRRRTLAHGRRHVRVVRHGRHHGHHRSRH